MNLTLKFRNFFCSTEEFSVNGVKASIADFGQKVNFRPDLIVDGGYGCGNMQFVSKPPTPAILRKYDIAEAEYTEIAGRLEKGLAFGYCSLCA